YGVAGENRQLTAKFEQTGIPYIYIGDYLEQSPLGKAEWMRVAAEITDCGTKADSIFCDICNRYASVAADVAHHTAGQHEDVVTLPRVLLNTPYRDTWFMPSAMSYMVRLIRDAGGDTYTPNDETTASMPVEMETAYMLAADADVWLNVGFCTTLAELTAQNPRFADIPPVREGRVYNNNARSTPAGGSDFWESGVVHPDIVLRDLAKILHPELYPDDELYYYRQLK
ncbi:MAG: ABC transporter substrate-binding protein, partial [Alistipes sp.]|nr:ABC transporter substrate-binding protein [Alistipes sp.]